LSGKYGSAKLSHKGEAYKGVRATVEVVDMSTYTSAVTLSILDKLLEGGHITLEQYLSRIPKDYIDDPYGLIGGGLCE
jgi:hypothetical protein